MFQRSDDPVELAVSLANTWDTLEDPPELLTALETYVYQQEAPLSCAITAFAGTEDATMDEEDVLAWKDVTEAQFSSHRLHGGHFFIQINEQTVHRQLRNALL